MKRLSMDNGSTTKNDLREMDAPRSKPSSLLATMKVPGLLDDFRKCIPGYDESDSSVKVEYIDEGSSSEAKTPNSTTTDQESTMNGSEPPAKIRRTDNGFHDVTRYNILDGTISHHTELSGLKAALLRQESQFNNSDGNVLRELLRQSGSVVRPRTPDIDSIASSGSPNQDPESPERFYPCKVCKKNYVSKSSLRKHFCMPNITANIRDCPSSQPHQQHIDGENGTALYTQVDQLMNGSVGSPAVLTPVPSPYDDADKDDDMGDDDRILTPGQLSIDTGERLEEDAMGPIYTCPLCSMAFRHTSQLMRHRRTHTNERPFECVDCHQAFRRKCHLKRHWQRIHSGEKPFKCAICGKAFSDRDHQRQHETIHGPETYPCFHCRCVFPSETYLVSHLTDNPDCKEAFARDGDSPPKRTRTKNKGLMTTYKCGLCLEQFKKLRQIQTHQRVRHHDVFEKKYKCNLCGKGFDLISDLTHHRNNHAVRSKLDVDKNGDSGYRPHHHHHHHPHNHPLSSVSSPSKVVQNKAELLQMLQQLEKRIQQQQQQVKQIENQQEEMEKDKSDDDGQAKSEHQPHAPHSQIRYILETSRSSWESYLSPHVMVAEGKAFPNGCKEPSMATAPVSPRSDPVGAMDLSVSRSTLEGSPRVRPSTSDELTAQPSTTLLDLMTNNRHKCEQCGLSFLLYSEFRAHRKRHERARIAIKQEPTDTFEYPNGNPGADKSLCRDCCNDASLSSSPPGSSNTSPNNSIDKPTLCFRHQRHHDRVAGKEDDEGQRDRDLPTRLRLRLCDVPVEPKVNLEGKPQGLLQLLSSHHSRDNSLMSCDQCLLLKKQLMKERNDKKAMRIEIERLREALVSFAEAAANHASPLRSSSELLALFSKNTARNIDGREMV